jgi:hypothetical protein
MTVVFVRDSDGRLIDIEFSGHAVDEMQTAGFKVQLEILRELRQLREEVKNMAEDLKALDAAVAQEATDVAAVVTGLTNLAAAQTTAFADLQAKIAANPTADFTAEVATLATNHASLTQALSTVTTALAAAAAADPGAAAPTTPPATTSTDIPTITG